MPCYNEGGYNEGGYNVCGAPICWNYTVQYRGSGRLYKASGPGSFPRNLNVPSNVDISTGRMIDDGIEIDPDDYSVN